MTLDWGWTYLNVVDRLVDEEMYEDRRMALYGGRRRVTFIY